MKSKKLLYNVSRWVIAALFIFSGFAKSVNPFGLSIQLGEYFAAMGMDWLKPLSALGAILLPSAEMLLGVMVAMKLSGRVAAWGVLCAMSFFTALTLWIALENPVNDCGCFGDMVKLTNWQTFIKNVALMPFVVIYFSARNSIKSSNLKWYIVALPLSFALSVYSTFNLPLIDATPFKVGINVIQAMATPADAPTDQVAIMLVYRNKADGTEREFTLEDIEWQDDSKWQYVATITKVLKEGYRPPIKSLPMIDASGNDLAHEVLAHHGKLAIVVTNDIASVDTKSLERFARQSDYRVVLLISEPLVNNIAGVETYNSDYSVINTMIQNRLGGVLLLDNGVIVSKKLLSELL